MSRFALAILAAAVLALMWAAGAVASPWPKDPRVCSSTRPLCAEATASLAARKHVGGPGGAWQGPSFRCSQPNPRTLLRWSCPFNQHNYTVVFSKSAGRWWVKVTP